MKKGFKLSKRAKDFLLKSVAIFLSAVTVINSTVTIMAHEPEVQTYENNEDLTPVDSEPSSNESNVEEAYDSGSESSSEDNYSNDVESDDEQSYVTEETTEINDEVVTDDSDLLETDLFTETSDVQPAQNPTLDSSDDDKESEMTCTCKDKCTADDYDADCPVCSQADSEDDIEAFLKDNCKGTEVADAEEEIEKEKEEIEPETVEVDNTVSISAVCYADGEEIEGTQSFELIVNDTVDVLAEAPTIEGYTLTDKATLENGDSVVKLKKETTEEKEESDIDGELVVTKITTTTSISYYDGAEWKELTEDTTITFEYTEDEADEKSEQSVVFTASFVDQDGKAIEGHEPKSLIFNDTLDLTKAPELIENYEYIEAQIDDTVVSSLNKSVEIDEDGGEVTTYSYTADGVDVEVTEDTEVTLIYEATIQEVEITLDIVDEEGNTIEGYTNVVFPEFDSELVLDNPEKAPVEVEGYLFKEASVDGTVISALVKETADENNVVSAYSYVTEDGETVAIEEDSTITLTYEEEEVVVLVDATILDEFGDEIEDKYTGMDISKIFNKADELILDDPENPPVDKVQVRQSLFKVTKYTYVKATVDKNIIIGLKREATKATSDLKDKNKEYIYSYTTDGENWTKIKEDTTVIFEYSDGKKSVYTYEDADVLVTATLQHANAIPDDAEFVVTPVTSASSGYNYDAYMEALNKNADLIGDSDSESSDMNTEKYTEDNTLLYDIAFLAAPVDENGETVEGDLVEYQPAEGMINISFVFKQSQLSEELGAEEAADIAVVHLPLADSIKESTATTADATGISAGDINIEVVADNISLNGSTDQADFCLSDFSVVAVIGGELNENPRMTDYSLNNILNNYNYFVFGNVINENHTVGAVIVGGDATINALGGTTSQAYAPQVPSYIHGMASGNGPKQIAASNVEDLVLYLGTTNKNEFNDSNLVGGDKKLKNIIFTDDYVDFDTARASIMSEISQINSGIYIRTSDVSGFGKEELIDKGDYQVYTTWDMGIQINLYAGNVYTFESLAGIGAINIISPDGISSANDTVIKSMDSGNVSFPAVLINGSQFGTDNAKVDDIEYGEGTSITLILPEATDISFAYAYRHVGHIIAPKAHVDLSGVGNYNGCVIADSLVTGASEGHMWPYTGKIFTPAVSGLKVNKTLVGSNGEPCEWPEGAEFTFKLTGLGNAPMPDGSNGTTKEITVTSTATVGFGDITFPYSKNATSTEYKYTISEVKGNIEKVTYDDTVYNVTVTVKYKTENNGNGKAYIDSISYTTGKNGNTSTITDENHIFGFTNTYENEKTFDMIVAKWWVDKNYHGLEGQYYPENPEVEIELYRNGELYDTKKISGPTTANGEWDIEWNNLPGNPSEYTAKEVSSFPGFTTMYDQNGHCSWTSALSEGQCYQYEFNGEKWTKIIIANVYNSEDVTISGSKTWDDDNNRDGVRPESITVHLNKTVAGVMQEVESQTVKPDSNGNWTWSFTAPKYEKGQEVQYSVTEDQVAGYENPVYDGYNIKNTHKTETVVVSGSKTWDDNNNQDGVRPSSITINLLADGSKVDSKTVTEGDHWSWTFDKLPKYSDGKKIAYTITEETVDGYKSNVNGYNVTNSYTPAVTQVSGSKTWDDDNNRDGKRPESITINLYANGVYKESKTVTEKDDWAWTFDNLDKYANGQEIKYTISEAEVEGYTAKIEGYDVTNTHTPNKVGKTVQKVWDDNNDQDGLRPSSIEVQLLADGTAYGNAVELNAENNWSYTWTELPEKKAGKDIKYTVKEISDVEGYTVAYSTDPFTIINTHTPAVTQVSGSKTWDDNNNQDGVRPSSITINLLADGVKIDSKTVTSGDHWSWNFTGLQKYKNGGTEIVYTITEDEVSGYDSNVNGYNVTNSHTPAVTQVSGSKAWNDNDDQDGARPESITINLYANGVYKESKTVTEEDGWAWTFDNLDKYANGQEIKYTISEAEVEGYTAKIEGYNVTNTHTPNKVGKTVQKVWDDNNNQDGLRPSSIEVQLLADGKEYGDPVTLHAGNGWSYTWSNLPEKQSGNAIVYTVKEIGTVTGYNTNYSSDTFMITNTHAVETTVISGSKTWNDGNNQDGKRPKEITIHLFADNEEIDSKTVTAANNWTWDFGSLPVYSNGSKIVYTIAEDAVPDYTSKVIGYNVTNNHITETTEVSGSKTWNDGNNQDGIRPESIMIRLLADGKEVGSQTVTEEDGWSWSFANLDKYADGKEITYTITEDVVAGYSTKIDGYDVTNSYTPGETSRTVTKIWDDNDNQDGIRPASIEVQLLAGGKVYGDPVTLTAENSWSYTWNNLPEKQSGNTVEYTVKEIGTITGYTTSYSDDTFTITNTHTPAVTQVSGSKTWDDKDNQDGVRPGSITIHLLADGEEVDKKVVGLSDNWSWNFSDLPKYKAGGTEITYTITEDAVPGYTSKVVGYNVTNSYTPAVTQVSGSKNWNDGDNQDGIRPESIMIRLLADGKEVGSQTVTEEDGWSWSFANLDKYADGKEITYTITEDVVAGYSTKIDGYDVTNSYTPGETSRTVTKIWDDNDNQDGIRPASIEVQLLAGGKVYGDPVALTAENSWSYTWNNLPEKQSGSTVEYTVKEIGTISGYTTRYSNDTFTITNTHTPAVTQVNGSKTWDDKDNQDGVRPGSITIHLWADGAEIDHKVVMASDNWSWNFSDLPKYKDGGTEITYTITEDAVPGYSSRVEGHDVINSHTTETTEVSGSKIWDDKDNQDGKRPESIKINLYADGAYKEGKIVTAADGWSWTFGNLDKYADGKEIKYTITEDAVTDYSTEIKGYNVTNSYTPEETSRTVTKIWDDNDNQDGVRPESIEVQLLADGKAYGEAVTLKESNQWSYTWNNLPQKQSGKDIEYQVQEVSEVTGYTTSYSDDTFTIKNAHAPDKVQVSGSKTWDDNDDQDGARPESIIIRLWADGTEKDHIEVTAADGWSWNFSELPKYKNGGIKITYTITEDAVEGYTTEKITGYDVTNTHEPEKIDIKGSKTWNDNDNQDGARPESIWINLMAGTETIERKEVTAADNWSWEFKNLDKYANGQEINYTITEDVVEDYSTDVNGYNVTNTHTPGKVNHTVTKEWNDNNDQDGLRPASIRVQLKADGVALGDAVELNAVNNWSYTWNNLDAKKAGKDIVYTAEEVGSVEGYTPEVVNSGTDTKIVNTHATFTTEVSGSKTWDDNKDQDGKRPDEITIRLLADGKEIESKVVTAADGWKWSFTDLPLRANGSDIVYTVTEDAVEGYTTEKITGYDVTNTHEPEKIDIEGSKAWDDNENAEESRPESITIHLYKLVDGEKVEVDSKTVTEADGWKWKFENLDKYADKKEILYRVEEDNVPEYTASYDGYDITNKYTPGWTEVSVKKEWDDNDNQDGVRPAEVKVQLYSKNILGFFSKRGDAVTLNAENGWSYTWTDLPENRSGKAIEYTVREVEDKSLKGYEASEWIGGIITNSYTPETIAVSGEKTWNDNDDQDGVRPESITIRLFADETEIDHQTVTKADDWKWSFEGLPKYRDGGIEIVYTITEDTVEGYTTEEITGFDVTNTHETATVELKGQKIWDDKDDQDGVRSESITVRLWADGEEIDSLKVDENDNWSWSFGELPKYRDGGIEIQYHVTEDAVEGYSTGIVTSNDDDVITTQITNSYTPGETSRTVNKVWNDGNNKDGIRPGVISVQLLADGTAYGDLVELNAGNGWSYTWNNLPEKKAGKDIKYTVEEISNVAGYTTSYSDDTFIITNSHTPAPEPTPTPDPGTPLDPGTTPDPGATPNPEVTPGSEPAPTPFNQVLGARRVKEGGLDAAVLGARRGTDYAVLGRRRRPSTGDSSALIIWILAMAAAAGGAITSGVMLAASGKEKKKKNTK